MRKKNKPSSGALMETGALLVPRNARSLCSLGASGTDGRVRSVATGRPVSMPELPQNLRGKGEPGADC
ncbi:unnamed protein product [Lampetra planeri]